MGRRVKVSGICKLCGSEGSLSFEHVPPKAAFNDGKYYYEISAEIITKEADTIVNPEYADLVKKGLAKKKQGGMGAYSLCAKCNNTTGLWYAPAFIEWAYQGMGILLKTMNKPTLYYPTYIYPLRIIKQILTMFFTVNIHDFRNIEPELVKFILNKEERFLSSRFKIYAYYSIEGKQRSIGNNFVGDLNGIGCVMHVSEIAFSPFGFVLAIDSKTIPDKRLTDITRFASYEYNHWIDHFQRFETLPTHLPFAPLDYRTRDEIIHNSKPY